MKNKYFRRLRTVSKFVKKVEKDMGTRIMEMSCLVETYDAVITLSLVEETDAQSLIYFRDLADKMGFRGVRVKIEPTRIFVRKYTIELLGV